MGKDDAHLISAKRSYREAKEVGNRHEEARWANVIGDILKNRGEYVQALKWLRIDYDVSVNHLPEKHVLPTCQSLGELYLRLRNFEDALYFQKKHLNLAKDAGNLVEQQRASTQLGRTYHDIYSESKADHSAVRNAKKYFNSAMRLAESLKKNPPSSSSSFVKEFIDAHNNIGMLELDLDNFEEAKNILMRGLEICNEEELNEYDDARSRLHHNLGNVYLELRAWSEARKHIDKDIMICRRIGHLQGEAKGCINLGELYYKMQKYEEAILSYQKALDLAKSMEDEDALVKQCVQNIKTVTQAMKVMDEIKAEEQNFKKLTRCTANSKGTQLERKCLLQQNALLDCLIDKSSMIFAWSKHLEFAKRKKRIATELHDKEKEGDSFLVLGESYLKLRNFNKAIKWYTKSWNTYKLIGSLEGQALAKINIGLILDCEGDWRGALSAFEESYRMAVEANLPSTQIQALENMHYSHMIRFDNVEEARKLQQEIEKLEARSRELENENFTRDCCPETDTEEDLEECRSSAPGSPVASKSSSGRSNFSADGGELGDDEPLRSFFRSTKCSKQKKTACEETYNISSNPVQASPKCLSKSSSNPQTVIGRKRVRIVLSDDEDEMHPQEEHSEGRFNSCPAEDVATSDGCRRRLNNDSSSCRVQYFSTSASKRAAIDCIPINVEESTSTHKSLTPEMVSPAGKVVRSSCHEESLFASDFSAGGSKYQNDASDDFAHNHSTGHLRFHDSVDNSKQSISFRIDSHQIHIQAGPYLSGNKLSIELMVAEVACLYYLQLSTEKRSKGLLPIIQHMTCSGRVLESTETIGSLKDGLGNIQIEVSIGGWVQKRLMKLYIDCCGELSETPNMKLLKKLYLSEVEDEVVASDCELQDVSVTPLINALHAHKTVAMLNLSHNLLGNGTMEGIQQFFMPGQKYGDLTLDLHCNRFGPTALFQICECPVLFTRLEVLNISGNRLTDACGSYLSTILENCKALYSLNIERCSITTRTIQKVADALQTSSVLAQLCIGYNNPISGNVIVRLLRKLATLTSFAELNLSGLKLNKPVVDSLSELIKTSSLSRLMLGSTGIGNDGALQLSELLFSGSLESARFDLSDCGLTSTYIQKLTIDVSLNCGIVELNLGGNPLMPEGATAVASLLMNPLCCLKILVLNKCQLGISGLVQLVHALAENDHLEELHLADNAHLEKKYMLQHDLTPKQSSDINLARSSPSTMCTSKNADIGQLVPCSVNYYCNDMEVADSEDEAIKVEPAPSELDDSCTSSCLKNSSIDSLVIHELSTAISLAKQLQFLDLSKNGFSTEAAETLYAAWSSRLGSGLAWSHIEDKTIHFSLETSKCCRIKPCCRRY